MVEMVEGAIWRDWVPGVVYILTNEAMPGIVKVGQTSDLEERMRQLDSTSVPLPFECFYAVTVADPDFVERQLHDAFADHRIRQRREFFKVSPERVAAALRIANGRDVTPSTDVVESADDQAALDQARRRRPNFNFRRADIPDGAVLTFVRNPEISCAVADARKVTFNGTVMSLSEAAQKALAAEGITWRAVQGPAYWEYQGETLDERRTRMEEDDDSESS
jgi:hypothetical protein